MLTLDSANFLFEFVNQSPLSIMLACGIAFVVGRFWYLDYQEAGRGKEQTKAIPGATPAGNATMLIAVLGSMLILAIETAGEYALEVSQEQSTVTVLFLAGLIAAGIIEEIVFRGYLVVEKRGPTLLIGSILGFSLLFALAHFHYWIEWKGFGEGILEFNLTSKSAWTLLVLFLNSLWFYAVRFSFFNKHRSLLPCFAAHIASNVGVFFIKLFQGHVSGLY